MTADALGHTVRTFRASRADDYDKCLTCAATGDHLDAPCPMPGTPLVPDTYDPDGLAVDLAAAWTADQDGTTSYRQQTVLDLLSVPGIDVPGTGQAGGITWTELARYTGWHHGQASGVLSVLHKAGRIARLTATRDRCAVYVLPCYVNGRETAPHGGRRVARVDAVALLDREIAFAESDGATPTHLAHLRGIRAELAEP